MLVDDIIAVNGCPWPWMTILIRANYTYPMLSSYYQAFYLTFCLSFKCASSKPCFVIGLAMISHDLSILAPQNWDFISWADRGMSHDVPWWGLLTCSACLSACEKSSVWRAAAFLAASWPAGMRLAAWMGWDGRHSWDLEFCRISGPLKQPPLWNSKRGLLGVLCIGVPLILQWKP